MKSKKFSTLELLATAVAAYEHQNRSIVRVPVTIDRVGYVSNRQLISDYVEGRGGPFIVNDVHHKQAEDIVQYLEQTVIMQSLKSTPDRFLAQISAILANKEVSIKDVGIVASAPKLVDDYQKKDRVREVSAQYEHHSRYVGHPRDKVTIDFTLIDKRYVLSFDSYAVYGVDNYGNLLFYWAKTLDKICEVGKISGRIKDHKLDEYRNNARVTVLNYVKVL